MWISEDRSVYHEEGSYTGNSALGLIVTATGDGGAVRVEGTGQEARFECDDCQFTTNVRGNTAVDNGGAVFVNGSGSAAAFANCAFTQNGAAVSGGAVSARNADTLSITGSTFTSNGTSDGGAIYVSATGAMTLLINDTTFTNNLGESGGPGALRIIGDEVAATLTNVLMQGNGGVGACGAMDGSATLVNVTVVDSATLPDAPTICGDHVVMINSVVWSNDGPPFDRDDHTVTYSDIEGGYAGEGNIDADPLLDGFGRLTPGSPCVDAADGDAAPENDIEGSPRVDDPDVANTGSGTPTYTDIGVYELQM